MKTKRNLILTFALLLLAIPCATFAQETEVVTEQEVLIDSDVQDPELLKLDVEDPLYWAKMRDVYTYQKKGLRKEGRFSVAIYTGIIPNNIFEVYVPLGLRLDYYVLENLGIEFASSYDVKIDTSLAQNLTDRIGVRQNGIILGDSQLSHTNAGILWSPLYGKTSWYEATINYFDVYLFGGLGLAVTQTRAQIGEKAQTDLKVEGVLGAGVNFFINNHLHLRLDYRQFVFKGANSRVAYPSEISIACGWIF